MGWFKAIEKLLGVGENLTNPEQNRIKNIKHLKYQLEAAQNYIFVDEKSGEYRDISDAKAKKLKIHFKKRVFDVI